MRQIKLDEQLLTYAQRYKGAAFLIGLELGWNPEPHLNTSQSLEISSADCSLQVEPSRLCSVRAKPLLMLLRQVLSLSRASGYVCRCPRVAECCNRRKPFKTVAQFSRQAYLPDEKISSYTADSVSAVRNAAKGLDAPFHVSGHVRLQQPLELSWQGSGRDCSAELPGKGL